MPASFGFEIELHNAFVEFIPEKLQFTKQSFVQEDITLGGALSAISLCRPNMIFEGRAHFTEIAPSPWIDKYPWVLTQKQEIALFKKIALQYLRMSHIPAHQIPEIVHRFIQSSSDGLYGCSIKVQEGFKLSFDHGVFPGTSEELIVPEFITDPIGIGPGAIHPRKATQFLENFQASLTDLKSNLNESGVLPKVNITFKHNGLTNLHNFILAQTKVHKSLSSSDKEVCWLNGNLRVISGEKLMPRFGFKPYDFIQMTCAIDLTHFANLRHDAQLFHSKVGRVPNARIKPVFGMCTALEQLILSSDPVETLPPNTPKEEVEIILIRIAQKILRDCISKMPKKDDLIFPWMAGGISLLISSVLILHASPIHNGTWLYKNFWCLFPKTSILTILKCLSEAHPEFYGDFLKQLIDLLSQSEYLIGISQEVKEKTGISINLIRFNPLFRIRVSRFDLDRFRIYSEICNHADDAFEINHLIDRIIFGDPRAFMILTLWCARSRREFLSSECGVSLHHKIVGFLKHLILESNGYVDSQIDRPEIQTLLFSRFNIFMKILFGHSRIGLNAQPGIGRPKFELRSFGAKNFPEFKEIQIILQIIEELGSPSVHVTESLPLDSDIDTQRIVSNLPFEWLWLPGKKLPVY